MIKVLIVDDSAAIRALLRDIISQDKELQLVAEAGDPYEARELIKVHNPDVLTLDVEMPRMDGITFLKNLMRLRPMPVIMLSTLTTKGAEIAIEALESGAIDCLAKPRLLNDGNLEAFAWELISRLKAAASSRRFLMQRKVLAEAQALNWQCPEPLIRQQILAIGASTGGTEAIRDVLMAIPEQCPPIVITQHIPPMFSTRFANRLDGCCRMHVQEATDGQVLQPGNAYIAPGDYHMRLHRYAGRMMIRLDQGDPVNRHRPSVDAMFDSLLDGKTENVTAMLLTGMGRDGAQGMRQLFDSGAYTLAQDEQSSMVWGMPAAAVQLGAAAAVLPLSQMAGAVIEHWKQLAVTSV